MSFNIINRVLDITDNLAVLVLRLTLISKDISASLGKNDKNKQESFYRFLPLTTGFAANFINSIRYCFNPSVIIFT